MKKKYRVVWADPAKLDLFEIIDFIAAENPSNARAIQKKIRNKVADLQKAPERGRVLPELYKHGITAFRELILFSWRIIYKLQGSIVYVEIVFDSRRNIEDLLFRRIMR